MTMIDDKIVSMSFENSKFQSGVAQTLSSLDRLKAALHFPNSGKAFNDLDAASKKVNLSHIAKGVDDIKNKLSALSVAALAVFAQIAQKAVAAGTAMIKSLTLDPVKAGYKEYVTNLNSIQTILANTQAAGTTLKDVSAALKELNDYSDKTIYNFGQMARNIGTFTAAGVGLKESVAAIKGIANLAALSGSNADQASTAMYQLSQALSSGTVKLMDWNSVVNAGMGGTVFQRALAQTGEVMGVLKKGAVELAGPMKTVTISGESFRNSLSEGKNAGWLNSKVLTATLAQFTGDLTDAQLAAQGFSDAQIFSIQQTAKTAMHAATEVKDLGNVFKVAQETAGSGWAETFMIVFGGFREAKKTFTDLSNAVNSVINKSADARNKVLGDWKALGGRTLLIEGIKTAFTNLGLVLKPIKEAFRDIFPAKTGKDLFTLTQRFNEFAQSLKPTETTIANLKRTFAGLFAIFSIIGQVIGGVITIFAQLFGAVGEGAGGFLNFTGGVGDMLVALDAAMKKGNAFHNFMVKIGQVLRAPIDLLRAIGHALSDLFSGFSPGGFLGQLAGMTSGLSPLQRIMAGIAEVWGNFLDVVSGSGNILRPVIDALVQGIQALVPAIGQAASNMNFEAIFAVIRTGLFAGLVLMFRNFLGRGSFLTQISRGFAGGIVANIAGTFRALQGSMVALQNNIKAKTLKEIAIAIALLTLSVVALSFVDPDKLTSSITAIGFMMAGLLGAMAILDKITTGAGFIKLPILAAGLILLAGAINLLTLSVLALSQLSWNELVKGLTGVSVLLIGITAASIPLAANSAGMIRAGVGITAMAVGLLILASAMKIFATMSWQEIAKGLVAVAGGLAVIAGVMNIIPKGMVLQAAALIAIAVALKILASAIEQMGAMDWGTIGKGLGTLAGSLVIIAGAMHLMPKGMVLQAAALLILSVALGKIADAVQAMGGMSLGEIARGLGTLAGSLAILAAALYLMSGAIGGAVALGVAAAGIALLAPALKTMGAMSWGEIIKSLVLLAGAMTVIGVAGLLLSPAIPALIGLGAALVLIGAGLALAGAGIFLIGAGLSALVVAAPAGVGILIAALVELQEGIIENVKLFVLGLLEIVRAFAATAPQFVEALMTILNSMIDGFIQIQPKLQELMNALINTILMTINTNQTQIIGAGISLLLALLQGINTAIPQLVAVVSNIIVNFLNALSNSIGRIVAAGLNLLVAFVRGMATGIAKVTTSGLEVITRFLAAIASGVGRIAAAGLNILVKFLAAIAAGIGRVIKAGTDIIVAFINGIGNAGPRIITAAVNTITKLINALAQASVRLADAGMKAMIKFLNGLATAIDANAGKMRQAGMRVGVAIIDGMTGGLASKAGALFSKISGIMDKAVGLMHKIPGVSSPSTVTMKIGRSMMEGLEIGLDEGAPAVYATATEVSEKLLDKFRTKFVAKGAMTEIGKFIGTDFAKGLRGSAEEIKGAFDELNKKMAESMGAAKKTLAEEQAKLNKLQAAGGNNAAAIREAQAIIKQNQALLDMSTAGHKKFVNTLKDEKAELIKLSNEYKLVGEKLLEAQEVLKSAIAEREGAITSFTDKYSTLPDIVKPGAEEAAIDQLGKYMDALRLQASAVAAYHSTLDQLRALGLDDATYEKLLEEGTADQAFADQLLAGGKTAVDALNVLDKELLTQAESLALTSSDNLYNAGIAAAKGLIGGLKSQKSALIREMEDMADDIVRAFNRRLKIKSPSEVFAESGKFAMEGMAKGISNSSKKVADAMDVAAREAMTAMQKSIRDISSRVTDELDSNPVITPILDLTVIRSQAQELGVLTRVAPISADASYGQAALISSEQIALQVEQPEVASNGGTSLKFEQNNYSPEALSDVDIYRQTRNQLSQLKTALEMM